MSALPFLSLPYALLVGPVTFDLPATSRSLPTGFGVLSNERAPDDALAFPVISFSGLQNDTEVRVFRFFGTSNVTELGGFENYTGSETITLPYFGDGNSTYQFQVFSLAFVPLSFAFPVPRNDITIPIVQQIDRVYSNP